VGHAEGAVLYFSSLSPSTAGAFIMCYLRLGRYDFLTLDVFVHPRNNGMDSIFNMTHIFIIPSMAQPND
jgi:hypothetical protein